MSAKKATDQQIINAIEKYNSMNGFPPSIRELAILLKISNSAVSVRLSKLKDQGRVDYITGLSRTLKVIKKEG